MIKDEIALKCLKQFAKVLKDHILELGVKQGEVINVKDKKILVIDINRVIDEIDGTLEVFTEWK